MPRCLRRTGSEGGSRRMKVTLTGTVHVQAHSEAQAEALAVRWCALVTEIARRLLVSKCPLPIFGGSFFVGHILPGSDGEPVSKGQVVKTATMREWEQAGYDDDLCRLAQQYISAWSGSPLSAI